MEKREGNVATGIKKKTKKQKFLDLLPYLFLPIVIAIVIIGILISVLFSC